MSTSLLTPFQIVGGRIGSTTDTNTQIEQKIVTTLTTDRLERVGIPDFGAGVNQLLFEPIDALLQADFKVDALSEMNTRVSGVVVKDLLVTSVDETSATINVLYQLPLGATRSVTVRLALPGTLTEESGI